MSTDSGNSQTLSSVVSAASTLRLRSDRYSGRNGNAPSEMRSEKRISDGGLPPTSVGFGGVCVIPNPPSAAV